MLLERVSLQSIAGITVERSAPVVVVPMEPEPVANMELFPDKSDATVDLPTPLLPTMETKLNWVLNSGTSLKPLSLSLDNSSNNPPIAFDSLELLKFTSQIEPRCLASASVQTLTLTSVLTSVGTSSEDISPWQEVEEHGSTP